MYSVRLPVLRLVRENFHRGYRRIHGESLVLGVTVAAFTIWEVRIRRTPGARARPRSRTAAARFAARAKASTHTAP
ncbi:hypothetical protein SAMN05216505_10632 [Streptomyces prasinopilosus]|uniref:Uncharacterized protein n=1 Tax=Streptomyces prasinopilosus TaxID=67344 RepID=A0A1G6T4K7_9ACTN|nr:hypothetical protein SAMN05216505_10632 [Streptomyces prasinopilosus]